MLCFFYDSKLRWYPEFGYAATSQEDFTKDDLHAHLLLRKDKYLCGLVSEHDREHIGFDIAIAEGQTTGFVRWVEPVPRRGDRMKSFFSKISKQWRRKSRQNEEFDGNMEMGDDAVSMQDLDMPPPTRRRTHLNEEYTHIGGQSSALD